MRSFGRLGLDASSPFRRMGSRWNSSGGGNWYDNISSIIGPNSLFCVYNEQVSAASMSQVDSWGDVRGTAVWTQTGAASLKPIVSASGISFDGIDDRLNSTSLLASIFDNEYTVLVGLSNIDTLAPNRDLYSAGGAAATTASQHELLRYSGYTQSGASSRQRVNGYDGTTNFYQLSLASLYNQANVDVAIRIGDFGGACNAVDLNAIGSSISTATRGAVPYSNTSLYLGGRYLAGSFANPWLGSIRYIIATDLTLADADLSSIYSDLQAQGLA